MSIRELERHARAVAETLREQGVDFCVVGGIAVSFRTVERTTKDIDLAVAVSNDAEAEKTVNQLTATGLKISEILEHDVAGRLSTVRLSSGGEPEVFVDLLFASSGIEREVVETADEIKIFPGQSVKVATVPSLIALKVLSADQKERLQDVIDLRNLIKDATQDELAQAKTLLSLITQRGFHRKKQLLNELNTYLAEK